MPRTLWPVVERFEFTERDRRLINGDMGEDAEHMASLDVVRKWLQELVEDTLTELGEKEL